MRFIRTLYYYGQDGEIVDEEIIKIFGLGTRELQYSDELKIDVFNIVGFVFQENKMLVIFPKNYFQMSRIKQLNANNEEAAEDIRLLYSVIKKYGEEENTSASARKYIGANDGYDSDYPFKPFYEVYNYYRQYGLYRDKENEVKAGGTGKISWKTTMRKANKVISDGNLLFVPLYINKKNYRHVFITDCMAFVIDHTLDYFHSFLSMKKTGLPKSRFDYLCNIDYVIIQLNKIKNEVFKDVHKKLIQSLIDFFVQYKEKSYGGKVHVKIRYFDMIWQAMIGNYLNRHFIGMSDDGITANFDENTSTSLISFADTRYNDIDESPHQFSIYIDHVAYVNNVLYIFDSKYYVLSNTLNYKQFSYNEILRYRYPEMTNMHNVLILPGRSVSQVHFSLSSGYLGERTVGTKIIEQYMEPIDIMKDYINS